MLQVLIEAVERIYVSWLLLLKLIFHLKFTVYAWGVCLNTIQIINKSLSPKPSAPEKSTSKRTSLYEGSHFAFVAGQMSTVWQLFEISFPRNKFKDTFLSLLLKYCMWGRIMQSVRYIFGDPKTLFCICFHPSAFISRLRKAQFCIWVLPLLLARSATLHR